MFRNFSKTVERLDHNGKSGQMSTIKVFGDSRLKYLAHYVAQKNNTTANIEIIGRGGATIRSTASEIWEHTMHHRHDVIIFNSGVNELTRLDEVTGVYKVAFHTVEEATDHCISAYQEFELNYHKRFPQTPIIFAQISGLDISASPYTRDYNPHHQDIINEAIRIINKELVNINERNWVPTVWMGKHIHRYRKNGTTTNYYRLLEDGLHPTHQLLSLWAKDIVKTAFAIS